MVNSVLIPILCTLLAGLIGYWFGVAKMRLSARYASAESLYRAFQPVYRRLETETNTDAIKIIEPTIKEQEEAVLNFMRHLPKRKARRLQDVWESYLNVPYGRGVPMLEKYADCGDLGKRRTIRPELLMKLDAILKFSKPI